MKTWVKVYTAINRDPDMDTLTWAHRGIWLSLLALAGEIDDRDEDELETGRLDTLQRVAWFIRADVDDLLDAVGAFKDRGMVLLDDHGIIHLPNYPKRQARPPSSRPSAVAERVKRHRDKAKADGNEDVTTLHRGVTPSETDPDPDSESDPESDPEKKQTQTTESNEPAVAVALKEVHALDITNPKATDLVSVYQERGELPALVPRLSAWIDHCATGGKSGKDQFANPVGFAITQTENGLDPPKVPDSDEERRKRYIEGEWADIIES